MKKLLILIALLLCFSLLLASCSGGGAGSGTGESEGEGEGEGEGGGNQAPDYSDYLYADGITTTLIVTDSEASSKANVIYNAIKTNTGNAPEFFYSDECENLGHEIVIGESSRSVSVKAYRQLRTLTPSDDFEVSFVIYAQGNSIAIAYHDGFANYALDKAITYLVDEIIAENTELNFTSGVIYKQSMSVLDDAIAQDKLYKDTTWAALGEYLGAENADLLTALQNYYKIYDGGIATWLANLFDADVGAFYYSNSARDNVGYAPDIESTSQALGLVSHMAHFHGGRWGNVLDADTKTAIGNYIKSLQDPNGYFYNYQWTKASHGTSRLARDLSSSMSILNHLAMKPTYNTPIGDKGDGIVVPLPDAAIPVAYQNTHSIATAVSKVVLAAHADYLESCETLLAYLNNLEKNMSSSRFYGIGSNITSQMNQIIARDKELRKEYEKLPADQRTEPYESMVDLVIDWFNDRQNPETGHWESTDSHIAVSGILKIMGIYNSAKVPVAYAEKMALAAFNAIEGKEEFTSAAALYNTWSSILKILNNLRSYGKPEEVDGVMMTGAERADKILGIIRANAPTAVAATAERLLKFKKEDGSFSYKPNMSSPTSQGMPVAVSGTNEGDVNGTVLATTGITNSMFTSLGISSYMISLFGESELTVFLYTLENLTPIIKDSVENNVAADEPVTFEDDSLGDPPVSVGTLIRDGSAASIVKDDKYGNVLEVHSAANTGDYVYSNNYAQKNNSCYIFETDVKVVKGAGYDAQITVGSHFMLAIKVKGDTATLSVETSTAGAASISKNIKDFKLGEWFNFRVEYYANGTDGKPLTKIYVDGKLVAISKAYYGQTLENPDSKVPAGEFEKTTFYIMKTREVIMHFDNMLSTTSDAKYTAPTEVEAKALVFDETKA